MASWTTRSFGCSVARKPGRPSTAARLAAGVLDEYGRWRLAEQAGLARRRSVDDGSILRDDAIEDRNLGKTRIRSSTRRPVTKISWRPVAASRRSASTVSVQPSLPGQRAVVVGCEGKVAHRVRPSCAWVGRGREDDADRSVVPEVVPGPRGERAEAIAEADQVIDVDGRARSAIPGNR